MDEKAEIKAEWTITSCDDFVPLQTQPGDGRAVFVAVGAFR